MENATNKTNKQTPLIVKRKAPQKDIKESLWNRFRHHATKNPQNTYEQSHGYSQPLNLWGILELRLFKLSMYKLLSNQFSTPQTNSQFI